VTAMRPSLTPAFFETEFIPCYLFLLCAREMHAR
jgi:hypothetical protein